MTGEGALAPGTVFGLLLLMALYNSHEARSFAEFWCSQFPKEAELDVCL